MTLNDIEAEVVVILRSELHIDPPDPDANLMDSGLLDSLGFVDLVAALERRFGITVNVLEVDLADFESVSSISCNVLRERA